MKKHFDNLGLPTTANRQDVRRAYRKLAMQLHPDKNPDPRAPGLFAELQESYDYLMHSLDPHSKKVTSKPSEQRKEKTKEERISDAKKRFQEQKIREQRANDRYFNQLTKGRKWNLYKIGSMVCSLLVLVVSFDLLLPKNNEQDEFTAWSRKETAGLTLDFVHPVYLKNAGKFFIENGLFGELKSHPTVFVTRTQILHLPMKILHPVEDELKTYPLDFCFSALLPMAILFFALPALLWFYRKKTAMFSFVYLFSLYVIFPLAGLFLLFDYRWLHLITLGWF